MKNAQIRSSLLALAGGYVLYLAWEIYDSMRAGKTSMPAGLAVFFILFFALAGAGVIFYAWKVWRAEKKGEKEAPAEPDADGDRLTKQ